MCPTPFPAVNEDVRVSLLSCLPHYLSRCASPAPDASSLAFLALGTRDAKEAIRRACLRAAGATLLAAPRNRWGGHGLDRDTRSSPYAFTPLV